MTIDLRAALRCAVALGAALASACSTGSSGADCSGSPAVAAGQAFTVSGTVTYDFVPAVYFPANQSATLDFGAAEQRPVREAVVQVQQCGNVLQTSVTDVAGHYSITFTPGPTGPVAVYVLAKVASPPILVRDNVSNAVWAVAQPISSATPTLDVHATHGWNPLTESYGRGRIAAPFAILDSMYTAAHALLDPPLSRSVPFETFPLVVNWSPLNSPSNLGSSAYEPSRRQIWVLGAEGLDADEFDRGVIAHEWSHYIEDTLSRADSPGGDHYYDAGDVLEPSLAFSEGYASAFGAMALEDRLYIDTLWRGGTLTGWGFDVETPPDAGDDPVPGPFSEMTVIRALWDLYDAAPQGVAEAWDASSLGLGPIYDALVGPQRTTPALTTIASFVAGLKETLANDAAASTAIDAVLGHYGIGPITTAFGDGEPRFRGLTGVYTDVPPPSSTPYSIATSLDGGYRWNERPQNQYFFFTATGTHATVTATSSYDVDLYAADSGRLLASDDRPFIATPPQAEISFATVPEHVYVVILAGWGGLDPYGYPVARGQAGAVDAYPATVTFSD